MWHLLLLLPPLVAMIVAFIRVEGEYVRSRRVVLVSVFVLLAIYFSIQDYLDVTGHYPFLGAKTIHDVACTFLVPMAYVYFGHLLKLPKSRHYFRVMLCLSIFLLPELTTMLFAIGQIGVLERSATFNYLHLSFAPSVSIEFQLYSVIVLIQIGIVFWRIVHLQRLLRLRELTLSRSVTRMISALLIVTVWIIVTLIPTHEAYANRLVNTIMICGYSFFITLCYAIVTYLGSVDLVYDSENKPVRIDNDSDTQLAQDVQHVIDHDKVYLNPNLRLEDLAAMIMSNRTYVARIFRVKFKGTFTEVMNRYRVEHAQQLMLNEPNKRIDEVAAESGFASSSFFGRVFKSQVGMTPTQWRAEQKGKR